MRAIVQDRYGSADMLELRDIDRPIPTGQVLVRVHAAGVDRGVWHLMTGLPYLTRLAFGLRRPKNPVPGMDLAGVVEAVGPEVTRFAPGDEVFGIGRGTFAEHAIAPEAKLAHKPEARLRTGRGPAHRRLDRAAGRPRSRRGRVRAGQTVLVLGASGGVGSYAVQLAVAAGAVVTGVASTTKLDLVRELGAEEVIDYTREDVRRRPTLRRHHRHRWEHPGPPTPSCAHPGGTLVIVGGEGGGRLGGRCTGRLRALRCRGSSASG